MLASNDLDRIVDQVLEARGRDRSAYSARRVSCSRNYNPIESAYSVVLIVHRPFKGTCQNCIDNCCILKQLI